MPSSGSPCAARHLRRYANTPTGSARSLYRISAQLTDAAAGHNLWAERYDGETSNVFALQDSITNDIVAALAVELSSGERQALAHQDTSSPEAYEYFLQGQERYFGGQAHFIVGRYDEAISTFKRGLVSLPTFERLHLWLAAAYVRAGRMEDAEWEADEVIDLNPDFTLKRMEAAYPFKCAGDLGNVIDALRESGLPE